MPEDEKKFQKIIAHPKRFETFGKFARAARLANGQERADVAAKYGCSVKNISSIENSKTVGSKVIEKWADAFVLSEEERRKPRRFATIRPQLPAYAFPEHKDIAEPVHFSQEQRKEFGRMLKPFLRYKNMSTDDLVRTVHEMNPLSTLGPQTIENIHKGVVPNNTNVALILDAFRLHSIVNFFAASETLGFKAHNGTRLNGNSR